MSNLFENRYAKYLYGNPTLEERKHLINAISFIESEIDMVDSSGYHKELKETLKERLFEMKGEIIDKLVSDGE